MTTMTDHNISDLGTTLEAWVNVVRIDREVGRDPRTDRDAQRALARRNELMDELHAEALAEYTSNTWCVVCLQAPVTPRHQVPAGTTVCRGSDGQEYGIRTRIVAPQCATTCGLTGTTECPTDNEATWACPTC